MSVPPTPSRSGRVPALTRRVLPAAHVRKGKQPPLLMLPQETHRGHLRLELARAPPTLGKAATGQVSGRGCCRAREAPTPDLGDSPQPRIQARSQGSNGTQASGLLRAPHAEGAKGHAQGCSASRWRGGDPHQHTLTLEKLKLLLNHLQAIAALLPPAPRYPRDRTPPAPELPRPPRLARGRRVGGRSPLLPARPQGSQAGIS